MKQLLTGIFVFVLAVSACAQQYVQGYYRKDGKYVEGYWRKKPTRTGYPKYKGPKLPSNKISSQPKYKPIPTPKLPGYKYKTDFGYKTPKYQRKPHIIGAPKMPNLGKMRKPKDPYAIPRRRKKYLG